MPIYEYQCEDCGEKFEKLVPMSAKTNPPCPKCSSEHVKKKISMVASSQSGCSSCSSTSCSSGGFS